MILQNKHAPVPAENVIRANIFEISDHQFKPR